MHGYSTHKSDLEIVPVETFKQPKSHPEEQQDTQLRCMCTKQLDMRKSTARDETPIPVNHLI